MASLCRVLRPLTIISAGFFAGVFFNFFFLRFFIDESADFCDYRSSSSAIVDAEKLSSGADYEPILVKKDEQRATTTTKAAKSSLKFERPRFYAEELGVKDKLLLAVISVHFVFSRSTSNFTAFAQAANRTMANYVNKIAYMMRDQSAINNFLQKSNQSMSLVFSHPKTVTFFAQLTILFRKYALKYDWLFLIDDVTFVKSFRLLEFVSHLWTPNYDVVLGNIFRGNGGYFNATICPFSAGGLLISTSAASKIGRRLSTDCKIGENSADFPDGHFAKCLKKENLQCSTTWKGKSLKSMRYSQELFTSDNLLASHAISFYDLPSSGAIYRLHEHFCALELKQIEQSILEIEYELREKFLKNQTLEISQLWPASVFPSPVPKNRFDILIWDYFTTGEIYEANKENNLVRKLNANEKRDIENGLNVIARQIIVKNVELIDGYRRFDPNRGLDYIFNVKIKEPSNQVSIKRFRLVKLLTRAELSPAPFATETSTVHIILPIIITNQSETTLTSSFDRLSSFLTNYESNNLAQRDEKIRLSILIGYFSENARLFFQPIGSRVEFLKRKFPSAGVSFLEAFVRNLQNPTLELVYSNLNLSDNELCLIINDQVQFDQEFLNRVRLNTLPDFQIFCPIPFVNFKVRNSNTVIATKEYVKISKHLGRFDAQQFSVCSFYWSDFKGIWLKFTRISDSNTIRDVLDLFLQYSPETKILRYAEPSLISDFAIKDCSLEKFDEYGFESCRYSEKANFASKKHYEPMIGL